jgi:hypothetical protein
MKVKENWRERLLVWAFGYAVGVMTGLVIYKWLFP